MQIRVRLIEGELDADYGEIDRRYPTQGASESMVEGEIEADVIEGEIDADWGEIDADQRHLACIMINLAPCTQGVSAGVRLWRPGRVGVWPDPTDQRLWSEMIEALKVRLMQT